MRHAAIVNFNNHKDESIRVVQAHERKPIQVIKNRPGPRPTCTLHLLFRLMELVANDVKTITCNGAILLVNWILLPTIHPDCKKGSPVVVFFWSDFRCFFSLNVL